MKDKIFAYVKKKYKSNIERLWQRYPEYAVFRHNDNKKWYGLVMNIHASKLGLDEDGFVDILNIKASSALKRDILTEQEGYFKGYHISRGNWVSVLLDGSVPIDDILSLIDESYEATASKHNKEKYRPPKNWLIPANPKYYDVVHAFDDTDVIMWKQGARIKQGDVVYIYVSAPISAVLFKCSVEETDIPCGEKTKALIRVRLKKRYDPKKFTFEVLKNKYNIFAVRGPRGIPDSLSFALNEE